MQLLLHDGKFNVNNTQKGYFIREEVSEHGIDNNSELNNWLYFCFQLGRRAFSR